MTDTARDKDGWKTWAVVFGIGCVALLITTCLLAFLNRSEVGKLRDRLQDMEKRAAGADEVEYRYEQLLHERSQERLAKYDLTKKTADLEARLEQLGAGFSEADRNLELARNERDEYFSELSSLSRRHEDTVSLLASVTGAAERAGKLEADNRELRRRLADLSRKAKELLARLTAVQEELKE